jgi:hypothetical protein
MMLKQARSFAVAFAFTALTTTVTTTLAFAQDPQPSSTDTPPPSSSTTETPPSTTITTPPTQSTEQPPSTTPTEPKMEMRSKGAVWGGLAAIGIGLTAASITGGAASLCQVGSDSCGTGVIIAAITGGLGLLVGIPLVIWGSADVPPPPPPVAKAFNPKFVGPFKIAF